MRRGVKLGALLRADNRGLAIQTSEFVRHMAPERVLAVDMGPLSPYPFDPSGFPGVEVIRFPEEFTPERLDAFLDGLDVVWTAETFYSDLFYERARKRKVRTAVHANFEFSHWLYTDRPRPDVFLLPSSWRTAEFAEKVAPTPVLLVPFPVAGERLPKRTRTVDDGLLHVAGHRANSDRNGTKIVFEALRRLYLDTECVIRSQHRIPLMPRVRGRARVRTMISNVSDYTSLYADGALLLAPRRYGGLSLPMQEAMASGMAVLTLDVEPQTRWFPAELRVPATFQRRLRVVSGDIAVYTADPRVYARRIEHLLADPSALAAGIQACSARAEALDWAVMLPAYRALFESIARGKPRYEPAVEIAP